MPTLEATDEQVAILVQKGDIEAFSELIKRYEDKMVRYARKFLFDREDGKDVAQEVFLKAYMNIKSFDSTRRFSPWLYRIAHNEFINAIKKKKRLSMFSFDFDTLLPHPVAPETADQRILSREMKESLDRSLAKLDPKYRELLILYYIEEMDYKEIAEILQIPIGTVGVRLWRGKEALLKIEKAV